MMWNYLGSGEIAQEEREEYARLDGRTLWLSPANDATYLKIDLTVWMDLPQNFCSLMIESVSLLRSHFNAQLHAKDALI